VEALIQFRSLRFHAKLTASRYHRMSGSQTAGPPTNRKFTLAEISNPNLQGPSSGSGGSDNHSLTILALVFLVVLLGYQFFFKPQPPVAAPPAQQTQAQSQSAPGSVSSGPQAQLAPPQVASLAQLATPQVAASTESTTTVENADYRITFTNRGAQVVSWVLKNYYDSGGKTGGKLLDLVQPQAAEKFGFPLSLFTYDPALNDQLNKTALYQLTVTGAPPTATGRVEVPATSALTFRYSANGLDVVKTFRFDSSFVIDVETQVMRNGSPIRALVAWPSGLGDMEEFQPKSATRSQIRASALSTLAWSLNGKQDTEAAPKVSGNNTENLPYDYDSITDLYFTAAFLPDAPERTTTVTLHNIIDLPRDLNDPNSEKTPAHVLGLAMGDTSGTTSLRVFAGPKAMDLLNTIHAIGPTGKPDGQSLAPLIHYGWMGFVAKPLYYVLRFLRGLLGPGAYNWGWAIIIFTAAFTLLMLPTRFMMLKSSLKMMRVQHKVDAIKKKYANFKATDPKRADMNAEMMELYKVEGVNMYGSCLPTLVQMPLFIAYFEVLSNVIELRQAHWFWLTDLSTPDPLHILPILIIVTMFITQIITPAPGMDQSQRRMMAIMMPILMGSFLWRYASGLALYWGTSNVINMVMQIAINQSHIGKEMSAIAAKRAAKTSGGSGPITLKGKR
jgi:YidC/Oxa1 family membrane protein insertase